MQKFHVCDNWKCYNILYMKRSIGLKWSFYFSSSSPEAKRDKKKKSRKHKKDRYYFSGYTVCVGRDYEYFFFA